MVWAQLTLLDQPVQHRSGFKNGCDARRVIAGALFKEMSEREHLLRTRAVGAEDRSAYPGILAGVVTGCLSVGADLYRTFLQ